MSSTAVQPESASLFEGLFLPVSSGAGFRGPAAPVKADMPVSRASLFRSPGLLQAKDFVLPELVGKADNGDLSVRGCVDDTQLKQVFVLAEVEEEHREFAALGLAEQHLEERRYKDFLKRKVREGLFVEELAVWLQGGAQAEENFRAWWEQKEQRRRTALVRKANRLANCRVTGRRLDCSAHPDHQFFGSFNCGVRYCRSCGAAIFSELFGKYMGLWPIVEKLTAQPGFRSENVIATLDFTAVNLYRMPVPKDIREFNQDVRACIRRVMDKLEIASTQFLFLWCDEFGGWDAQKQKYNTNLHAHGVYVGPFLPYEVLLEEWMEIRKSKDGARGVYIKRQKLDHAPRELDEREHARFARALGHALKYTGKHQGRADGERLAKLEAAFHGVRRVHTMGLAYHAALGCSCNCSLCETPCAGFNGHQGEHSCKRHRAGAGCPKCASPLMFPRDSSYAPISLLKREGRVDVDEARRQAARDRTFAGPRGAPQ